ncbi:saccharopine dehydrogenase family protein [Novilysobacter spongiicola]|uniref:Saccharopine dehydrogenase NADP binding domain-containing protein n=1 Tax=Lysobacter spongiicola DSM 21749 TaxID=1122188 RepID=A0A1T4RI31_9GAMM|nr:saccharopine dehydrogenase NADP-binding domain-containing protein [Lysobacter spongiicola]SKA15654.1 Saccharopine dehydrogenase NADP binding domain-containing protein [Lysobacter spongiicola DSM 21749]
MTSSPRFRTLIIGAYGQFGRRIAEALSKDPGFELLLAGRNRDSADALAAQLIQQGASAAMATAAIDVEGPDLVRDLAQLNVQLVIHTAGPFQQRDYRVAEAALECGAHYIDLADGRDFVMGIGRLDQRARAGGRWVVSGASSLPGLSAAVIEAHRHLFSRMQRVEAAISPGNRTARGLATTQAILGYVGHAFPALINGHWQDVHGWQSLRRIRVPGAGTRWVARCDVPDLGVLPTRYPELRHCDFRAGLELRRMHFGLWLASWLVRGKVLKTLARWSVPLLRASEWWLRSGSDTGLMTVHMDGLDHTGSPLRVQWHIIANEGSGPQIPATAAVVLARKLAHGLLDGGGARPCLDLFTLDDFMHELERFPIHASATVTPNRGSANAPPAQAPGTAHGDRTSDSDSVQ